MEEGRRKDNEESSMTMDSQEARVSKRVPAEQASEAVSPPPKLTEKRDGAKPVHEPGHQPNVEQEESTIIANIETKLGTTQDHQKTIPRRSTGCQKMVSIEE